MSLLTEHDAISTIFTQAKIQGVFKQFSVKSLFSRAFQVPLKSKIKFQGFSRTSRGCTNPGFKSKCRIQCLGNSPTPGCIFYLLFFLWSYSLTETSFKLIQPARPHADRRRPQRWGLLARLFAKTLFESRLFRQKTKELLT